MLAPAPALRAGAREAGAEVGRVVADVNQLGVEMQRAELPAIAPELLEKIRHEAGPKELPPLPDAADGRVVLRLTPDPSAPSPRGNAPASHPKDAHTKRHHGKPPPA